MSKLKLLSKVFLDRDIQNRAGKKKYKRDYVQTRGSDFKHLPTVMSSLFY